MLKTFLRVSVLVGLLFLASREANSQEIVHALTGSVSAINTSNKTITLLLDSGSQSTFKVMSSSAKQVAFDKKVAEDAVAAKAFAKQGAYVIVFYYGTEEDRTAVAVKSLGEGPFSSITGEVSNWNGHERTLSVTDDERNQHALKVDAQTVAETYMGVVNASKFDIQKGDRVRLVSSMKNGVQTVLFIRQK